MRRLLRLEVIVVVALVGLSAAAAEAGELDVEFRFNRLNRIASNQLAVWVEDSHGHYLKTLFVTDFTARRAGYRRRAAALPMWVRAFDPASRSPAEVDAVSRATPRGGPVTLTWDMTDEHGNKLPAGSYRVHVEGNVFWESMIYYTIPVELAGAPFSFEAQPAEESADPRADAPLITGVRLSYRP